ASIDRTSIQGKDYFYYVGGKLARRVAVFGSDTISDHSITYYDSLIIDVQQAIPNEDFRRLRIHQIEDGFIQKTEKLNCSLTSGDCETQYEEHYIRDLNGNIITMTIVYPDGRIFDHEFTFDDKNNHKLSLNASFHPLKPDGPDNINNPITRTITARHDADYLVETTWIYEYDEDDYPITSRIVTDGVDFGTTSYTYE
ncbi:MAG: hypothetical protein WBA74_24150, partial [Cyclobacteriaceae bacterium]